MVQRVIQILWIVLIAFSGIIMLPLLGEAKIGETGVVSQLLAFIVSMPTSLLVVPLSDVLPKNGVPGWLGVWASCVVLGFVQWFVLMPRLVAALRRRAAT